MISEDNYKTIDELIRQNRSFAIWRVPGEKEVRFRMQSSGSACLLNNIEALNERSGFVIAPFRVSEKHPIVLIQPDCFELPSLSAVTGDFLCEEQQFPLDETKVSCGGNKSFIPMKQKFHAEETKVSCEEEEWKLYTHCFQLFTQPLLKGIQDKLVLSRKKVIAKAESFSPGEAFGAAVERYVRSYVYLCHTPQTGTWMGGTPEILLSGENGEWQTVALAGTQPIRKGVF